MVNRIAVATGCEQVVYWMAARPVFWLTLIR